jgi:hypothetical protein
MEDHLTLDAMEYWGLYTFSGGAIVRSSYSRQLREMEVKLAPFEKM